MAKSKGQSRNSEMPTVEYRPLVTTPESIQDCIKRVRRRWRGLNGVAPYHRVTVARMHCQNELTLVGKKISGEIPFLTDDRVFVLFEATFCPVFKNATPIISDARCRNGSSPPFAVFDSEAILTTFAGAVSQFLFTANWPQAWYPIKCLEGIHSIPIQWSDSEGKIHFAEENIDTAFECANASIARWKTFWETDERWEKEFPSEWFRIHFERLVAHVQAVDRFRNLDRHPQSEIAIGDLSRAAHSLPAVRFLSAALVADGAALGPAASSPELAYARALLETASVSYPAVKECEFCTPEFWSAVDAFADQVMAVDLGSSKGLKESKRGRKARFDAKADAKLATDWAAAKASRASQKEFCVTKGISHRDLLRTLARVRKHASGAN